MYRQRETRIFETINHEESVTYFAYHENGEVEHKNIKNNKGELHNENGPASVLYYENGEIFYEEYWINDKQHNENGPAVIAYHPSGIVKYEQFYLNNKRIPSEVIYWCKHHNITFNNITKEELILRKIQIGI